LINAECARRVIVVSMHTGRRVELLNVTTHVSRDCRPHSRGLQLTLTYRRCGQLEVSHNKMRVNRWLSVEGTTLRRTPQRLRTPPGSPQARRVRRSVEIAMGTRKPRRRRALPTKSDGVDGFDFSIMITLIQLYFIRLVLIDRYRCDNIDIYKDRYFIDTYCYRSV